MVITDSPVAVAVRARVTVTSGNQHERENVTITRPPKGSGIFLFFLLPVVTSMTTEKTAEPV